MRYQDAQQNKRKTLENFLPVLNFILFVIIAICFDYLVIDFLF